jgi:hypothetical protein
MEAPRDVDGVGVAHFDPFDWTIFGAPAVRCSNTRPTSSSSDRTDLLAAALLQITCHTCTHNMLKGQQKQ